MSGIGNTRDISWRGVFVWTDLSPLPGTHIELEVFLPLSGLTGNKTVSLVGEGNVLRVETGGPDAGGFAASVDFRATRFHPPLAFDE